MSREIQIEEMAVIVSNSILEWANDLPPMSNPHYVANTLYNAGYQKQSENTVELPCKVGDTVYRVKKRRGVWCILPREVVSLTYRLDHLYRVVWEIFSTETDVLGKSVFITEAEAEEALAKMKGGEE